MKISIDIRKLAVQLKGPFAIALATMDKPAELSQGTAPPQDTTGLHNK
ncbi:hypothetical protein [Paenibacillus puerhi]|nr:hypothetical protein [Paenibacillus puerhi]